MEVRAALGSERDRCLIFFNSPLDQQSSSAALQLHAGFARLP